jgi:hypothetical protein
MQEEDDKPTSSAGESGTAPAGKEFNPSDLDEEAAAPAEPSEPTKAVPIGRPISEAEYDRRKERARDVDLPAGVPDAQEDPAHRERDR